MTNQCWYNVKVKYTKQMEDGRLKRVTEPYLFDSISFTDAEARCYEEVGSFVKGEFLITGIKKENIADIFYYEDEETWYKGKISYMTVDADSGKEKKISHYMLVTAKSVKQATERFSESLADMTVTPIIKGVNESSIIDVFPYNPEKDNELDTQEKSESSDQEEIEETTDSKTSGVASDEMV